MTNNRGFTIVELLVVIVIIGILAALIIIGYNGIQSRAKATDIATDIRNVHKQIELYYADNGVYPSTGASALGSSNIARTDDNCAVGSSQADWVPSLSSTLPQSSPNTNKGVNGNTTGCYMYTSDGVNYLLSAWNMLESPQNSLMYRRIGFREMPNQHFYYCNQVNIGGNNPTPYLATRDYYKYSYTVSNVTSCNETPPSGA